MEALEIAVGGAVREMDLKELMTGAFLECPPLEEDSRRRNALVGSGWRERRVMGECCKAACEILADATKFCTAPACL